MKTVRTFTELTQAIVAQNSLAASGIESSIPSEDIPAPYAGNLGRIELQVADHDFEAARTHLDQQPFAQSEVRRSSPATAETETAPPSETATRRWLSRLALVELSLGLGLYLWGLDWPEIPPGPVQSYLDSFAFGDALWDLGSRLSTTGLVLQMVGLVFFILQMRVGRWPYAFGIGLQIAVAWMIPAGIAPGTTGGLWWIDTLVQGALLAVAFGLVKPASPNSSAVRLTPSSGS